MEPKIKVIHMGRAAGKTTKGLQALSEAGGGIYITRHSQEARLHAQRMNLNNVQVLAVNHDTQILIDDVDQINLTVTTTYPPQFEFIERPDTEVPC